MLTSTGRYDGFQSAFDGVSRQIIGAIIPPVIQQQPRVRQPDFHKISKIRAIEWHFRRLHT